MAVLTTIVWVQAIGYYKTFNQDARWRRVFVGLVLSLNSAAILSAFLFVLLPLWVQGEPEGRAFAEGAGILADLEKPRFCDQVRELELSESFTFKAGLAQYVSYPLLWVRLTCPSAQLQASTLLRPGTR